MFRVVVVAGVIVLLMAAVRDGELLRRTHLLGSCGAIATPHGQTGAWQACRPGRLEGRPDLTAKSCTRRGLVAEVELWRCPARVASTHAAV